MLHPIVLRDLFRGNLQGGLPITLHESVLGPFGIPSHPPHKHCHEEMIMLIEGTLDFNLNGLVTRSGPGLVMYSRTDPDTRLTSLMLYCYAFFQPRNQARSKSSFVNGQRIREFR
jgi:hypothetical protein